MLLYSSDETMVMGIGCGYVTSQMGTALTGDLHDIALRDALYKVIERDSNR